MLQLLLQTAVIVLAALAHFSVFAVEVGWFLLCRRPEKIGEALGHLGRSLVKLFLQPHD